MSTYTDITDGVQDDFPFVVRGKKYIMRYPITEEIEQVQELSNKVQLAEEEKRTEDVKALAEELEAFLYGFITPVEHSTPIKEALSKENIKVMRNFNAMIKTEMSIQ